MKYTEYDIIKKFLGEIEAVGESNADEKRLNNLDVYIEVVDKLIFNISNAACDYDRVEYSMQAIGKKARAYLKELYLTLKDEFE